MSQNDLFGGDAKAERDAALKRVREGGGDWEDQTIRAISVMMPGFEGTGEDIRIRLLMKGHPPPHDQHAWGSMIKRAIARRVILPTGQRRHMKSAKSHARETKVYLVRS